MSADDDGVCDVEQLKNLMVVGVDTYHDSAKKGRSVGAFVASMNQTLTRYYSNCGFQSCHEELQNNLCTFMIGTYVFIVSVSPTCLSH